MRSTVIRLNEDEVNLLIYALNCTRLYSPKYKTSHEKLLFKLANASHTLKRSI